MELVLATGNHDKQKEILAFLSDLPITIRSLSEFQPVPEIIEDGETCEANAVKKAVIIAKHTGRLTLADDTGLEVEALGGVPGVYAARYAGENATYSDNCQKLLKELQGGSLDNRHAMFVTVVAIAEPSGLVDVVEGRLEGKISETVSGTDGFGYDPVFYIPEVKKTMAELKSEEKNKLSHRGQAMQKFRKLLLDVIP